MLIPEQSWDEADRPESGLRFGRPTGSATPLLWAHAEYIQLLRSSLDGRVFDEIPPPLIQFWTFAYPVTSVSRGQVLRIMAKADFALTYSLDNWAHVQNMGTADMSVGIHFTDIAIPERQESPIVFTFYWRESERWEGRDFTVEVNSSPQ